MVEGLFERLGIQKISLPLDGPEAAVAVEKNPKQLMKAIARFHRCRIKSSHFVYTS